jgi:formamidopyrimidine-DNA glycosylase
MPELPEVETVRRQLLDKLIGKTILSIEVLSEKQVDHNEDFEAVLRNLEFAEINRIGKLLIFKFKNQENVFMLGHLKMTGQIIIADSSGQFSGGGHTMTESDLELPSRHTRIIFNLSDNSTMYFNDLRKFGYMKTADKKEVEAVKLKFGPEPIDPDFDCDYFFQTINKSKMPIKPLLLDQSKFAGLGNIYVDEALWRSKINPARAANQISQTESAELCRATTAVLSESIQAGGTTFKNFIDTNGSEGNFTDYLAVFNKQGTECSRCGNIIKKIKLRGRGTHYCPHCQV